MSDLAEMRRTLLWIAHPEKWLKEAERYIKAFEEAPDMLEIPAAHAWLAPAVTYYARNQDGWISFVRSVRDRLTPGSPEYEAVRDFHADIDARRYVNRTRRLTAAALEVAITKGMIKRSDAPAKVAYVNRCRQVWKKRRELLLKAAREETPNKRLSVDVQAGLLAEMWSDIESEIANGEVPKA